ncbi:MAG: hypothetical protein ACE5G5_12785 [Candidatus Methylomirabilales bacterium]
MRRILMFMGVALLAFPLVASGAVKVRTKVGGYKWDVPAGKRLAKGFKAPVKAGPFTLGFHTQIEMDFESNHQFDFSEEVADGFVNNGVTNKAKTGVNDVRGLKDPKDDQKGDEFQTEFRFGMDAVAGAITTHVVMEQTGGPVRDRTTENNSFNVERAWGDVDLGWFNVRYGIELYSLEPTLMLYGDDDPMLSIYKNTPDFAWRVTYMKRVDADADAGRTSTAATTLVPGAVNTSAANEGTNNDTDVVMVILEIPFANPLGPGTFTFQPFYVLDHDKRFKDTDTAAVGTTDTFDGTIISHYIGANIITNLGPVKATLSGVFNFGEDDTGFNAVDPATGAPRNEVDISAWQAFAEFAYPVPGIPLTVSVGTYLASGDDDPFDDNANGWLGVSHNSEMFNGRDIFIDKTEDGAQTSIRLQSPAGVVNAGEAVQLSGDDDALVLGLSSFNNVASVAAPTTHPTRGVTRTPGSNVSDLDPYSVNNRSHPGVAIANVALKYKLLKNATVTADYQHIRLLSPDGLSPLATGRTVDGILTMGDGIDGEYGNQFGVKMKWSPAKYIAIEPGFVVLVPGDAIEDLTGEDDTAWTFRLGMRWNF